MSVRVAVAGVGSCASSLVQLVASAQSGAELPGVRRSELAGIAVGDVEFVAAFDVDRQKVGLDLREAILADVNAAKALHDVPAQDVVVQAGPLCDGLEGTLSDVIVAHRDSRTNGREGVVETLREREADVLVCYVPTGAGEAVRTYAESAAAAGVAFVNATPEPIARLASFDELFRRQKSQLLGDDTRSLLGATTVHAALIELFKSKGVEILGTYQINVGGNTDFLNLADPARAASKVTSKRNALTGAGIDARNVLAGPNGFVEFLGDTKVCHLNIVGRSVLGTLVKADVRLEVDDSPNSAGVIIDAVRVAKAARENGMYGTIGQPCAMLFKSPPVPVAHTEAVQQFEAFLRRLEVASAGNGRLDAELLLDHAATGAVAARGAEVSARHR